MSEPMDLFTRAYLACALELEEGDGDPRLAELSTYDLPPELVRQAQADCDAFRERARAANLGDFVEGDVEGYSEDQAAYDLWLTRNGHGSGFWDRELGTAGDKLTGFAEDMGSVELGIGDDDKPYLA